MTLSVEEMRVYIGREVEIHNCVDWNNGNEVSNETIVLGIKTGEVYFPVKPKRDLLTTYCSVFVVAKSNRCGGYTQKDEEGKLHGCSFLVHPDCVRLKESIITQHISPYNSTCKKCGKPALRNKSLLVCSNNKCSITRAFKKAMYSTHSIVAEEKESTIDRNGYVLCPRCKSIYNLVIDESAKALKCLNYTSNSHNEQYYIWNHKPQEGHKLYDSRTYYGNKYVWSNDKWNHSKV
jgi:hypothetical protein